jgi:hypothetical protein
LVDLLLVDLPLVDDVEKNWLLSLTQLPVVLLLRRLAFISQLELEGITISRAYPFRFLTPHTPRLAFIAL